MEDKLEYVDSETYKYYEHSQYPLMIDVDYNQEKGYIDVVIHKLFKEHIVKEMTKSSKLYGHMTKEQISEYVLDCVEIFLKK